MTEYDIIVAEFWERGSECSGEEVAVPEGDDSVRADGNAQIADSVSSLGPERELLTGGYGYRYESPFSGPK